METLRKIKTLRAVLLAAGLAAFGFGCASSNRPEIPILSSRPMRPYHVLGYLSTYGDDEARQAARKMKADALILVDINPTPERLGPPATVHTINRETTIKVTSASHNGGRTRRTYMAIHYLPAAQEQ